MNDAWLTILGIGDNGLTSLTSDAYALFESSTHIIAPERVLEVIPAEELAGKKVTAWATRIHETIAALKENRGVSVTILATGDPYHYGIAATMARHIGVSEMQVIPSPSGFSLAASRLGWAVQDVDCISLHGRAVSRLQPFIQPDNRILSLTSTGATVHAVAEILIARGFEASRLTVLEHIGGARERIVHCTALETTEHSFADFNMLAIECVAGDQPQILSTLAGLPDDAFEHDGQLTKRDVRAATLSRLSPYPNALLWDIGAGCGSVAIEWMRAARGAKAIAFERDARRLQMIATNAKTLGVPKLECIAGDAPSCLPSDHAPDAIFIGGGLTTEGMFDAAWQALRPRGILVANVVTLEGEARLIDLHAHYGGELVRHDISILTHVGRLRAMQPKMSVLQLQVQKK